jgi:hypothetical protein
MIDTTLFKQIAAEAIPEPWNTGSVTDEPNPGKEINCRMALESFA